MFDLNADWTAVAQSLRRIPCWLHGWKLTGNSPCRALEWLELAVSRDSGQQVTVKGARP